jgi:hypothetical protein
MSRLLSHLLALIVGLVGGLYFGWWLYRTGVIAGSWPPL